MNKGRLTICFVFSGTLFDVGYFYRYILVDKENGSLLYSIILICNTDSVFYNMFVYRHSIGMSEVFVPS